MKIGLGLFAFFWGLVTIGVGILVFTGLFVPSPTTVGEFAFIGNGVAFLALARTYL